MSISIRQMKYFVATAELGQISRAAMELSISQSAITTSLKELEQVVGAPLFKRSSHGMTLTSAGREFLSHAYEILAKVDEAINLNVVQDDLKGKLSIAATYTVMGYFLPFHLEQLGRRFPGLDIQLHELNREVIEEGLLTNLYDIAVVLPANILNPALSTEILLSSKRCLWVPSRHPLLKRKEVRLADIADEPYVMLTVDEAANTSLKYWSKTPFQPSVKLRTSSVEAVRSMVANGLGIAILSDMVHRPWSLEGKHIETIVLADDIPAMDIGLAWQRNAEFTPAMDMFRSYFRQCYQIPQSRKLV